MGSFIFLGATALRPTSFFEFVHRAYVDTARHLPTWLGKLLIRALNLCMRTAKRPYEVQISKVGRMLCRTDDLVQAFILHFRTWEPNVSALFPLLLKEGDVFVDIGANVGFYTLLGASIVGPNGRIVSIEANRKTFEHLTDHININSLAGVVRPVNAAVTDQRGTLPLFRTQKYNSGADSIMQETSVQLGTVTALPLDELLTAEERKRAKLIKIDIEGAEPAVLHRLVDTIDLYRPDISIIAEMSAKDAMDAFSRMLRAGFNAYAIKNFYSHDAYLKWREPSPPVPITTLPTGTTDILFTRI
jgi:FkbM family methyltransferase